VTDQECLVMLAERSGEWRVAGDAEVMLDSSNSLPSPLIGTVYFIE